MGQAGAAPQTKQPVISEVSAHDNSGLPPVPQGTVTLFGGTIRELDQVRDRIVIQAFGGGDTTMLFDARTNIYRDGSKVTAAALKRGDRIYADTVLDGKNIFARTIRLQNQSAGQSNGQVLAYDPAREELTVRDTIAAGSVRLLLDPSTVILRDDQPVSVQELRAGSLVAIQFRTDGKGQGIANRVVLLASPGASFVFAGRLAHVDERQGLLVVTDPRDNQSYELSFDPAAIHTTLDLSEGAEITVTARFNGRGYVATAITLMRSHQ